MAQTTPRKPLPPRSQPAAARGIPAPARAAGARRPTPKRRRKAGGARRVLGALALVLLGLLSLFGGYTYRHSTALRKYLPSMFGHGLRGQTPADVFPGQPAINLLIIGRDYDYTDKDQIIKSHARSDVLMVAHVDFARKTVDLLSIPRDTSARIPHHGVTKINAAHEFGGPELTARTVQENFGILSDKYIALDFDGFQKAIDMVGGVDLVVDRKMDYDDDWGHLHIHLRPGYQHLDGEHAMEFVRFRHADSDLVRVKRQQALLAALKTKLRQPQTLARLPAILDVLDAHVQSDLSTDQKVVLARFIHDTPRDQIQMSTLPSRPVGNKVLTNWAQATPMIQAIFAVTPPLHGGSALPNVARRPNHRHRLLRVARRQ